MTTTRSIFQKICPACMVALSLDARECACGHQFDHDDTDAAFSSEEIRLQAEELYENYLAARAEQAASAVMSAQAEFARDPANSQKSQQVARAIEDAEKARAALAEQSARVAQMRKALPKPAPAPRPAPVVTAPKKPAAIVKPAAFVARPMPAPPPVRTLSRHVKHADTDDAITTSLVSRRAARKAASASPKPKTASAPVPAKPVPAPVAAQPQVVRPPAQTRTPNPAFRQAQAARAEKILRQAETVVAVKAVIKEEVAAIPPLPTVPKAETRTPPVAAPLTRSAPRLLGADKKECPNCTASVDCKLARCRCGFEFPASETLMPGLAMSEEERAEFAKLFRLP